MQLLVMYRKLALSDSWATRDRCPCFLRIRIDYIKQKKNIGQKIPKYKNLVQNIDKS